VLYCSNFSFCYQEVGWLVGWLVGGWVGGRVGGWVVSS